MRMRILDFQGQSPLSAAYGLVLQSRRCLRETARGDGDLKLQMEMMVGASIR